MNDNFFIPTQNYQRTNNLCQELLGPSLNVDIAAVISRAGRGKTTAAERIYSVNSDTIYFLCQEKWGLMDLLREICFQLSGVRPRFRAKCTELIQNELAVKRRLIMVDEADRTNTSGLNALRNLHDQFKVPILLIGEESLLGLLGAERRLFSRVREVIRFDAVSQADIVIFVKMALDQALTPAQAAAILRHSGGDYRFVKMGTHWIEKIMTTSDIDRITDDVVTAACENILSAKKTKKQAVGYRL